jgi:hypothetical protein
LLRFVRNDNANQARSGGNDQDTQRRGRGEPREASSDGTNTKLPSSVQPRLISSNSPMLAVPG